MRPCLWTIRSSSHSAGLTRQCPPTPSFIIFPPKTIYGISYWWRVICPPNWPTAVFLWASPRPRPQPKFSAFPPPPIQRGVEPANPPRLRIHSLCNDTRLVGIDSYSDPFLKSFLLSAIPPAVQLKGWINGMPSRVFGWIVCFFRKPFRISSILSSFVCFYADCTLFRRTFPRQTGPTYPGHFTPEFAVFYFPFFD